MAEKLLLVTEVADVLRCSVSTVYALLETRRLIGHRCPGWRVKPTDLDAYLETTRRERESPRDRNSAARPCLKHIRL